MNEALKKSYDLEKKGLEFYINSAVKSANPLARRALFALAQEEIKHMIKIDDIALSIDKSGKWPDAEAGVGASGIEESIKEFFDNSGKEAFDKNRDNADFIKKAMEFERKSYELYADFQKRAGTNEERRFYDELKKQEEEHYEALENVYYYLTSSGDWFGKDESGVWGWMNL